MEFSPASGSDQNEAENKVENEADDEDEFIPPVSEVLNFSLIVYADTWIPFQLTEKTLFDI